MQVTDFPTLAPSCCFICRTASSDEGYVDTHHNFDPPGITELNGRKYLCAGCVRDAASSLGLFDVEHEKVAVAQAAVKDAEKLLEQYAKFDAFFQEGVSQRMNAVKTPEKTKKTGGK